jgi:hypothetical protein
MRSWLDKEREQLKATVRQQRRIAWLLGGVAVLMGGSILGLIAWINEAFIRQELNRYWNEEPYRLANFAKFVLKPEKERALKPGDSFRECEISDARDENWRQSSKAFSCSEQQQLYPSDQK